MNTKAKKLKRIIELKNDRFSMKEIALKIRHEFGDNSTYESVKKLWQRNKNSDVEDLAIVEDLVKERTFVKNNSLLKKSNNQLLDTLITSESFIDRLTNTLDKNPLHIHKPIKVSKSKNKISRTIVGHLSDLHYGTNISKDEVNGVNEYNWKIAARRTAFFVDQLAKYKLEHRAETDLVLLLNGDIMAGIIHNQEGFVDLMTTQFAGTLHILTQGISYLAGQFKSVKVYGTTGNHDRFMHKLDKGRATTHKWDSFTTMLFVSLKHALAQHKNVDMIYSEAPFIIADIQGHKNLITHSDTVISVGNVGSSVNTKRMKEQINDFNVNLHQKDRLEAVFVGHVHVNMAFQLDSGTFVFVNGNMSGIDPFAQSLGIGLNTSKSVQQIVEITKDHYGDTRMVQTQFGDNDASLDKIIKPFSAKF